jgi:hypothetical protein
MSIPPAAALLFALSAALLITARRTRGPLLRNPAVLALAGALAVAMVVTVALLPGDVL